ncbi:hypothetical protein Cgig2_016653 [Carnegiea gigantea]|uniref:AMP-dependent synthetase/ligase domain-containing protein n=1 Tax=Carnegiea gigantea TaxID=171969 RepID=A0A9Q1L0V3_9CARY|nr:hypothetical protein Cgig2_016653 [Carnegiea gigantea]
MEVVKAVARQGSAASTSIAVRADRKSYSYGELLLSAQKISNLLCASDSRSTLNGTEAVGSRDGTRVGIVAKPSPEFVAGVLGTWLSGRVAVPLALSYPEAELLHVMSDSDVSIVLSTEDHQELMQTVASKSAAQFSVIPSVPSTTDDSLSEAGGLGESTQKAVDVPVKVEGEDAALILYTSGTTGKPKGVVHTHRSVSAQVEFMPKFSVSGIWQRWRESYPEDATKADSAVTVFTGVPTMYTRLIQGYEAMEPDVQAISASAASKLRLMMCGSSALPYPVMQQWETITGHRLLERYVGVRASARIQRCLIIVIAMQFVMALSNPLRGLRKGGTVGKPLPGVEVKILAEDGSGNETKGVGELCIRSPSLFREYWKLPEASISNGSAALSFCKTSCVGLLYYLMTRGCSLL